MTSASQDPYRHFSELAAAQLRSSPSFVRMMAQINSKLADIQQQAMRASGGEETASRMTEIVLRHPGVARLREDLAASAGFEESIRSVTARFDEIVAKANVVAVDQPASAASLASELGSAITGPRDGVDMSLMLAVYPIAYQVIHDFRSGDFDPAGTAAAALSTLALLFAFLLASDIKTRGWSLPEDNAD